MKRYLLFLFLLCLIGVGPAWGTNDPATKVSRGIQNTAFGWFEIVNEIGESADKHGFWMGFPEGILRGSAFSVVRMGAGVFEIVSFPFPNGKKGYDAIVLPESAFKRR